MGKRIAVITTDFLSRFTEDMIHELDMGFQYHIFTYKTFEDIKEIYEKIGSEYDGILASGSFPAHMIRLYYPEEKRPIACFNTDDTAMYRLLLKLLQEDRKLDFNRVYADIIELFGGNLKAFVEGREAMPDLSVLSDDTFTMERMQKLEEEQYEKHLNLWKKGKTDLSITRFSSIVTRLRENGVKVYFPYPGRGYVQNVCERLLSDIEKQEMEERQPGVIVIRLLKTGDFSSYMRELDVDYVRLENMVMEMFGHSITEFSLHRYHYGLEILAAKKEVLSITENLSKDGLFAELKKLKTGWNFCIGYGFGSGIAQARLNALNACHEAELKKNTSYIVTEKEELIGPLGAEAAETFMIDNQSYRDIKSKLSPITVSKVMSALEAAAEKEITAQELAFRLGVTKRSANRFLSTLESEGVLEVAYKKRTTSRGRPESVFVRKEK